MKKSITKTIKIIIFIVIALISLYNVNYLIQKTVFKKSVPTFFGLSHVKAVGLSMEPTISSGTYLVVLKQKSYNIGDVVCFVDKDNQVIVHRIVDTDGEYFITCGDANEICDDKITLKDIQGKVLNV